MLESLIKYLFSLFEAKVRRIGGVAVLSGILHPVWLLVTEQAKTPLGRLALLSSHTLFHHFSVCGAKVITPLVSEGIYIVYCQIGW